MADLCGTFFVMPVDPDSQSLFAFTWNDQQYTWTVLPQGYMESPIYFSQTLKSYLADVTFPNDFTLLQYVDN